MACGLRVVWSHLGDHVALADLGEPDHGLGGQHLDERELALQPHRRRQGRLAAADDQVISTASVVGLQVCEALANFVLPARRPK